MDPAWDVIVIGAGAAGLMAALRAAERGRRTLVLEKNSRPGVKILMSGGTRCNLTQNTDRAGIIRAFGKPGRFLHSPLAALSPQQLVEFFHAEGVPTKVEGTGKVFPVSDRAQDVLDALLRRLSRSGCRILLSHPVRAIDRDGDRFRVATEHATFQARQLLIATGGKSYPGCGTTGDGYAWARQWGHTIIAPRPALTPLTTDAVWVRALQGVTISDVRVTVVAPAGESLAQCRGSLLCTHFGVSGPAVLNVSREVTGHAEPRGLQLVLDWVPDQSAEQLEDQLRALGQAAGGRPVARALPPQIVERLGLALVAQAGVAPQTRLAELGRAPRRQLVEWLKRTRVPVSGALGFKKAEVTAGGVCLDEVDSRTLQSRLMPGLFLAGEVLDLDGPIGGYNFQAAFSTGWLAGESV